MSGSRDLYARTLSAFLSELRVLGEPLNSPTHPRGHQDRARYIHTLKGLAATAGVSHLVEVFRQCESQLKQADSETFCAALEAVQRAVGADLAALEDLHALLLAEAPRDGTTVTPALLPTQRLACLEGLQQLKQQLVIEDYDAMNTLAHIQKDLAAPMAHALEPLQEAMAQLDFEEALLECERLIGNMNTYTEVG
jgi:HPt (histidine-containing phosphotransfer) domain-containing protein